MGSESKPCKIASTCSNNPPTTKSGPTPLFLLPHHLQLKEHGEWMKSCRNWLGEETLCSLEQLNRALFICLLNLATKKLGFVVCMSLSPLLYFSINSFLLNFIKLLVHDRLKTLKTSFEMVRSMGYGRKSWIWNWDLVFISIASDTPRPQHPPPFPPNNPSSPQGNLGQWASLGLLQLALKAHQRVFHVKNQITIWYMWEG